MSAYVCNPEHFGILAAYAALNNASLPRLKGTSLSDTAQSIARVLAKENIRSVAYRYPDDKDGDRPGPCLFDDDIEEAAALFAAFYVKKDTARHISPVQVLKFCRCYAYQSCETDDWKDTVAWSQLDWIISHAVQSLPGYDGFPREQLELEELQEVAALYDKREKAR